MRRISSIVAITILALSLTGCQQSPIDITIPDGARPYSPTVDIPYSIRKSNWPGSEGGGSCVHATAISLFRWQGRYAMAEWWAQTYENGEYDEAFAEKCDRAGVRYAYTSQQGDVKFLEWACSTRRGCGVTVMGGRHMVALVHFDDEWAGILDNNFTEKITWIPRETFVAEWLNSTSWAYAFVYTPPPPPLKPGLDLSWLW